MCSCGASRRHRELQQVTTAMLYEDGRPAGRRDASLYEVPGSCYEDGRTLHDVPGSCYEDGRTLHDVPGSCYEDGRTLHDVPGSCYEDGRTLHDVPGSCYEDRRTLHEGPGSCYEDGRTLHDVPGSCYEDGRPLPDALKSEGDSRGTPAGRRDACLRPWRRRLLLAVVLLFLWPLAPPLAATAPSVTNRVNRQEFISTSMQKYLMRYGYLPQVDLEKPYLRSMDQLKHAIKTLQTFAGLPATGVVDRATEELLSRPRCGQPDIADNPFRAKRHHHGEEPHPHRTKRYALQGSRWHHTDISWSLKTDVPRGLNRTRVKRELQAALDLWARPSKLYFPENNTDAKIEVYFQRGYHDDGYPFDGRGSILAHAFFPGTGRGGDVHFDEDEVWLMLDDHGGTEGTSLFAVAAHEFGHSLGLMHSSVAGALMYPWYQGLQPGYQLPDDDKHAIQQLYGSRDDRLWALIPEYKPETPPPPPPRTPSPPRLPPSRHPITAAPPPMAPPVPPAPPRRPVHDPHKPDTCNTAYDAVAVIRREVFIFKGKYLWRIGDHGLSPGYPAEIHRLWYGLPKNFTHIDAVYERNDKKIVFFIGKEYYVYSANQPEPGYPRPLTDLGLPSTLTHIDGAMIWGYNGKTYLFSGTMYWRLDEDVGSIELDYPRDMSMWRGVGYNIDAVFQWKDGVTYFFKGKGYWKFNDLQMRVEHRMPKPSASFWMGCPEPKGRWLDWEDNFLDIYNDVDGSFYDQHIDDDYDDASDASSVMFSFTVFSFCLSSAIFYLY